MHAHFKFSLFLSKEILGDSASDAEVVDSNPDWVKLGCIVLFKVIYQIYFNI